jgi:oligopeptide transport system substrate-binding protein
MTMPTRREFLGSTVAALVAGRAVAQPATNNVLRRVVSSEITSLDPQRPTGQVTTDLAAELFSGLTYYDRGGRLAPGCALSWQSSPDGLVWTFRLRDRLSWSDGRTIAAPDFVYTLRRYLAPETAAPQSGRLESIRGARAVRTGRAKPETLGVSAPDARTVRIELEHPDVELPALLSAAYCVPEHVISVRGKDWLRPEYLVSNGAYALDQWAPGDKIIRLRRNPRYYDAARVAIERVEWLTGYDDATRLRLFKLGEVEISSIEDSGNLATARREMSKSLYSSPEAATGWIGFNVTRGRLADPRVRRALSLAIDRRLITDRARALGEQPSDALLPAGLPGHPTPALPDYAAWPMPQRMAAARELLRQAGVAPNSMPPLVLGYAVSPTFRKVFLAVSAMWQALGVRTELQPYDGRAYNVAINEGRFDVFSYATFAQVPSAMFFLDRFLSYATVNFCRWRSAEFDRVLLAAQREIDPAQRSAGFTAAERVLLRELPVTPIWIGSSNRLISARVTGWVDHPGHAHPSQYLGIRPPV